MPAPEYTRRGFLVESLKLSGALALPLACTAETTGNPPAAKPAPKTPATELRPTPPQQPVSPVALEPDVPQIPLAHKLAQLLLVGFRGQKVGADDPIARAIREHHLGGVLLFERDDQTGSGSRNIKNPKQLRKLVHDLHALVPEYANTTVSGDAAAGDNTLIVAIDQEGGYVNRLRPPKGFPKTRSAERLGRIDNLKFTRNQAEQTAETLAQLGINFNLAPVVDLKTNPKNPVIGAVERSFGADVERVVRHAQAIIEGHRAHGIRCAIKHFPGHGSSKSDSHLGFVDITETWQRSELEPFSRLIKSGHADAVMTGHLFLRTLDPEVPATLSRKILHKLLREQLGHQGIVISDDLHMGAITDNYKPAEAFVRALTAGVDILIVGNNAHYDPDCVAKTVDMLGEQVVAGKLAQATIERAYTRVRAFKRTLLRPPRVDGSQSG